MDFGGKVLADTNVQLPERTVAQALERLRDWVSGQQVTLFLSREQFFDFD